ncbi:MAG: hypothetical protein WKG52_05530 [Variovorax sp.]
MKPGLLEFCFGLGAIGIGAAFGISEQEICQNKCWLDAAADFVLPMAFDAYSGAVPWVLIGLLFIGCMSRKK